MKKLKKEALKVLYVYAHPKNVLWLKKKAFTSGQSYSAIVDKLLTAVRGK